MKKLLGIVVLSLLFSGVAYAKKIHDANENGILMTECVFAKGKCHRIAANHCAQYKKFFVHVWNHQAEKDFTVRMYCVTEVGKYFYEPLLKKQLEVQKTNFDPNSPWATKSKVSANSSTSGTSSKDKITQSKQICKDLGFKTNTEKFADCALKMMTLQFEASNKQVATGGGTQQQIIIKEQQDYNIFDAMIDLSLLNTAINSAPTSNNTNCRVVKKHWGADLICR